LDDSLFYQTFCNLRHTLLFQEPANYEFSYEVNDPDSGSDFGHEEDRQEEEAKGSYYVLLPDGRKQIVEYEADEEGYKPMIRYEEAQGGYPGGQGDFSGQRGYSGSTQRGQGPY
jgi:hypothetical protein